MLFLIRGVYFLGDRLKGLWMGALLLWIALFASTVYAVDKGLLRSLGFQELSGSPDAPPFTLKGLDGRGISLKELKGKVVLLHFWATWCKPCKEEFPAFERMYQMFKDKGMVFLPISIDAKATNKEISTFAKGLGASFSVYLASDGNVSNRYWTWGVPVTYLIDKNGLIVGRALGPRDWDSPEMIALIEGLLNKN